MRIGGIYSGMQKVSTMTPYQQERLNIERTKAEKSGAMTPYQSETLKQKKVSNDLANKREQRIETTQHEVAFSKRLQDASDRAVAIGNAITEFDQGTRMNPITKTPYDPSKDQAVREAMVKDLAQAQKDVNEIQKLAGWK